MLETLFKFFLKNIYIYIVITINAFCYLVYSEIWKSKDSEKKRNGWPFICKACENVREHLLTMPRFHRAIPGIVRATETKRRLGARDVRCI